MKRILLSVLVIGLFTTGCENWRAKHWGGTMTVNLPANTKLVNATWKEGHLWYLYRPMQSNEVAVTSTFSEKSNMGVLQGNVVFVESK